MNLLSRFVDWVFDASRSGLTPDAEAYLARAVDISDLERRMRALDEHRAIGPFGMNA